jgi:hypothetical protein
METALMNATASASIADLQARFQRILPAIERVARFHFRHLRCPQTQDDKHADVIGLCWKWLVELDRRGVDASRFASILALRAAQAVKAGRRVTRMESKRCVLAERTQQLGRAQLHPLPQKSTLKHSIWMEALTDNHITPPDEAAIFRLDWPSWLSSWGRRDRRLITDMARSEGTLTLARRFGLSPSRISQRRREYHRDWRIFCGDEPAVPERQLAVGVA